MQVQGGTFLVSGGGSGLGAATAARLVASGARVVVADLAPGEWTGEKSAAVRFVKADVTDTDQVKAAVDLAVEVSSGSGLRGVVHTAGIVPAGRVINKEGDPHPLELFAKGITVNLIGTFNVIRLAAAAMVKNAPNAEGERGVIINTASIAAFEGQVGQAAYAASKGGVVSMTLPIARELARHGIRVVTIAPGVFETPMATTLPPKVVEALAAAVPFPPRLGRPQEFAQLAQQIIENPMLNGTTIRLDGAMRMAGK